MSGRILVAPCQTGHVEAGVTGYGAAVRVGAAAPLLHERRNDYHRAANHNRARGDDHLPSVQRAALSHGGSGRADGPHAPGAYAQLARIARVVPVVLDGGEWFLAKVDDGRQQGVDGEMLE